MAALPLFNVSFMNTLSGRVIGLYDIHMKVPLSQETLLQLKRILETELYYILTFSQQENGVRRIQHCGESEDEAREAREGETREGEMTAETFAEHAYQRVLRAFDYVSELFGEGATIAMDLNLEHYQADAFESLAYWETCLSIGACTTDRPHTPWTFIPFSETNIVRDVLEMARVM